MLFEGVYESDENRQRKRCPEEFFSIEVPFPCCFSRQYSTSLPSKSHFLYFTQVFFQKENFLKGQCVHGKVRVLIDILYRDETLEKGTNATRKKVSFEHFIGTPVSPPWTFVAEMRTLVTRFSLL